MMLVPAEQPQKMTNTIVTCLCGIGRQELTGDGFDYHRNFNMHLYAMAIWFTHRYSLVVHTFKMIADIHSQSSWT